MQSGVLRFSNAQTSANPWLTQIQPPTHTKHAFDYDLKWAVGGLPFLTPRDALSDALSSAIKAETGLDTELSTTGGTSDGRFTAQICPPVIEYGPTNASIHKIDEHVAVTDIEPLKKIYRRTLENLLG